MNEHEAWQQRLAQLRKEIPGFFTKSRTVLYVGATPFRFQMGRELFEAGCEITLLEVHKQVVIAAEAYWMTQPIS